MTKPPSDPDEIQRKSIGLPKSIWQEIKDFRFDERISTESEAIRRLLIEALRAYRNKSK